MRDRADTSNLFDRVGQYSTRDASCDSAKVSSGDCEEYWTRDGKRSLPSSEDGELVRGLLVLLLVGGANDE